jgi:hypothetical protein
MALIGLGLAAIDGRLFTVLRDRGRRLRETKFSTRDGKDATECLPNQGS